MAEWRMWLSNTMFYCGIVLIPFATLFSLPTLLKEKHYELIFIDLAVCALFIVRLIVRTRSYKLWGTCWIAILYVMTLSFYVKLGPHYARSAWLVMNTIVAALFFGSKGALAASLMNPMILIGCYSFIGVENTIWSQVHDEDIFKYVSFVINTSSLALVSSLLVGFLLDRLEFSYQKQMISNDRLNESERKHRRLVSNISEVITVVDEDGIITYKSPSIEKQFGWKPEELIGRHSLYTAHKDDQDKIREKLNEVLEAPGKKVTVEYNYLCKDGSFKPVELTAVNMLHDSIINGILANYRDVSERQKAYEKLCESEEKFRTIFRTSLNPITITSIDTGIYVDINDGFTRQLDYSREDIIGKSALDMEIWDDPEDRKRLMAMLEKSGMVENFEAKFKGKNGQVRIGLMSARLIEIKGQKHLFSITQDITELRQSEKDRLDLEIRLQQAQKMEAIGTLAGGIAHDFNNILSGIFGYSQLALNKIDQPDKVKDCIFKIDTASKRATELVRQILTFSRQAEYQKHPLQIENSINEALQLLRSSIPVSIEIKNEIDSEAVVLADPTKMHQLLINLCTNAYHSIEEESGTITVSLADMNIQKSENTKYGTLPPGEYVELRVSDTGAGIDKKNIEKIFDPYFTTKQLDQGTGLGLAIVEAIVKEHNGFITVASDLGCGTTFFICLPVFKGEVNPLISTDEEYQHLSGSERILIVDDEISILQSTKEILTDYGYKVFAYSDGQKAIDAIYESPHSFDLIITDMTMPVITGDILAKKVLEIRADLPIILCTGYNNKISEKKALEMGIKKFIQKPIVDKPLPEIIREVLDSGL